MVLTIFPSQITVAGVTWVGNIKIFIHLYTPELVNQRLIHFQNALVFVWTKYMTSYEAYHYLQCFLRFRGSSFHIILMKTESFIFSQSEGLRDPSVQDLSDSHTFAPGALAIGAFLAPSTLPAEEF